MFGGLSNVCDKRCGVTTLVWICALLMDPVSGGRYGDPSELSKLVAPLVIVAVIFLIMLGMLFYFYWRRGKINCNCDCCIKFQSVHVKMDSCSCGANSPTRIDSDFKESPERDLFDRSGGCGASCRCEQTQRRLDAAAAAADSADSSDTSVCVVCTKTGECSNCASNDLVRENFPVLIMPGGKGKLTPLPPASR